MELTRILRKFFSRYTSETKKPLTAYKDMAKYGKKNYVKKTNYINNYLGQRKNMKTKIIINSNMEE